MSLGPTVICAYPIFRISLEIIP